MGVKPGEKKWLLSEHTLPVCRRRVTGVKLKGQKVMWVGGEADDPADNNRTFIYDVRTRTFRETTPVPAAKHMGDQISVGVLRDGSVVVAGGAPNRVPPGTEFGGPLGDGGRNQLLCYAVPGNRVVIAGGQDTAGGDLYDTYVFRYRSRSLTRGPDLVHGTAVWAAQHPELGLPPDHQAAVISSQAVCMNNSRLVFRDGTLVHGGGHDGVGDDPPGGSRYVEQLTGRLGP
jgi:hypothetical protein